MITCSTLTTLKHSVISSCNSRHEEVFVCFVFFKQDNRTAFTASASASTFFTSLLISPINEQVAWTLWEPGQGEELQECWDTCAGEQDGPVLLFAQELSEKTHIHYSQDRYYILQSEAHILFEAENQVTTAFT